MQCESCKKIWQTHECNEVTYRCPKCGSTRKDHTNMVQYGSRLILSHILTQVVYDELIFGSESGRTWHTAFGEVKGIWIEKVRGRKI